MNNPEAWKNAIAGLGKQLVEALKPVAEKMGVAAEHLYGVLVRQALVESITYIVSWSLLCSFLFYAGHRMRKWSLDGKLSSADAREALCSSWVLQIASVVLMALVIGTNLPGILNPEYYAIKELLDTAKMMVR